MTLRNLRESIWGKLSSSHHTPTTQYYLAHFHLQSILILIESSVLYLPALFKLLTLCEETILVGIDLVNCLISRAQLDIVFMCHFYFQWWDSSLPPAYPVVLKYIPFCPFQPLLFATITFLPNISILGFFFFFLNVPWALSHPKFASLDLVLPYGYSLIALFSMKRSSTLIVPTSSFLIYNATHRD